MLKTNHQILCNKKIFQNLPVYLFRGGNLVTVLYVLGVINMQNEIEGVKKDTICIRGDTDDIKRVIYKMDQNMTWMKEQFPQVTKNTFANPDVLVTGEFCIFGFCFSLNRVINVSSSSKKVEHGT